MPEEISESDHFESLSNRTESYSQPNINPELQEEIQSDNICFFKQLQVHQESIFEFIYEMFEKFKPQDLEEKITKDAYDQDWA